MNAWGEDYHELDVYSYGRSGTLADYVDGLGPFRKPWRRVPYEITRNVNPDRHARIRQKHFHVAWVLMVARAGATLTLDGDRRDVVVPRKAHPHHDWEVRFVDVANAHGLARRKCDWGTR